MNRPGSGKCRSDTRKATAPVSLFWSRASAVIILKLLHLAGSDPATGQILAAVLPRCYISSCLPCAAHRRSHAYRSACLSSDGVYPEQVAAPIQVGVTLQARKGQLNVQAPPLHILLDQIGFCASRHLRRDAISPK